MCSLSCVQFYYREKHELELKKSARKANRRGYGNAPTPRAQAPPAARTSSAQLPREYDEADYVVPTSRGGMRARPRNMCYKESELGATPSAGAAAGSSSAQGGTDADAPSAATASTVASSVSVPAAAAAASASSTSAAATSAAAANPPSTPVGALGAPAAAVGTSSAGTGGTGGGGGGGATTNRWSDAERTRLVDGVEKFGLDDWSKVST